jgi:hypothetical protein
LEKNQVRSTVFKERKKASNVSPLIGVEAEDGEKRGQGLPILHRERHTFLCPKMAATGRDYFSFRRRGCAALAAGQDGFVAWEASGSWTRKVISL